MLPWKERQKSERGKIAKGGEKKKGSKDLSSVPLHDG